MANDATVFISPLPVRLGIEPATVSIPGPIPIRLGIEQAVISFGSPLPFILGLPAAVSLPPAYAGIGGGAYPKRREARDWLERRRGEAKEVEELTMLITAFLKVIDDE